MTNQLATDVCIQFLKYSLEHPFDMNTVNLQQKNDEIYLNRRKSDALHSLINKFFSEIEYKNVYEEVYNMISRSYIASYAKLIV